jgi:hypothetical protein
MNIGDRIKFSFGETEKEGVVTKIFPKKVYLKVDFPNHPGKTVIRSLADLEGKNTNVKMSKRREKAEKEKKAKQEKREKAQMAQEKKGEEEKEQAKTKE